MPRKKSVKKKVTHKKTVKKKVTRKKTVQKKVIKKKTKEEDYFVGIVDPIEIRRNILESSKEAIELLQMYEKFKSTRAEKRIHMENLKKRARKISILIGKLKKHLPQTSLRAHSHKEIEKETKIIIPHARHTKSPKVEEKIIKKELSDIEKLELELSSIERKLDGL